MEQAPMKVMVDDKLIREVLTLDLLIEILTEVLYVVVALSRAQVIARDFALFVQHILNDTPIHV